MQQQIAQCGHPAGDIRDAGSGQRSPPLRGIAARLVIATGKKKGEHPSPATVLRMLRDHDEKIAAVTVAG